jgi:hypothetical protein
MSIGKKIAEARIKISVSKDGVNKFGGYNFIQLPDIYKACVPVFEELGIVTFHRTEPHPLDPEKMVHILKAVDVEDGSFEEVSIIAEQGNDYKGMVSGQMVGAHYTYIEKRLYGTLLMINDGQDDPDKTNDHGKGKTSSKAKIKPETAPKTTSDGLSRVELRDALEGFSQSELKEYGISNLKLATLPKLQAAYTALVKK